MKQYIFLLSLVLSITSSFAAEQLQTFSWDTEKPLAGGLVDNEQGKILRLENTQSEPQTFPILKLENPPITQPTYALAGEIRYDNVADKGYLEMWNGFADGSRYFSRTLTDDGPMQSLQGSSSWRPFQLVFFIDGPQRPNALEVNLVLPGRGSVELRGLALSQYAADENPLAVPGQWWSERQSGIVGAILGSIFGLLGALIGTLGGMGKARGLVLGLLRFFAIGGIVLLLIGLFALFQSQPFSVYYPLLLTGIIATVLGFALTPSIQRRYQELELRKMQSMDIT